MRHTTTTAATGRCERHAGDQFAPRCDACAATGAEEYAARRADAASRDAALAAQEIRAGRMRSAAAHLTLAADACAAARYEARRISAAIR